MKDLLIATGIIDKLSDKEIGSINEMIKFKEEQNIIKFWKEIRKLPYSSHVWNHIGVGRSEEKYSNFDKIALKYGIFSECCNNVYDKIDYKFCPKCGKEL